MDRTWPSRATTSSPRRSAADVSGPGSGMRRTDSRRSSSGDHRRGHRARCRRRASGGPIEVSVTRGRIAAGIDAGDAHQPARTHSQRASSRRGAATRIPTSCRTRPSPRPMGRSRSPSAANVSGSGLHRNGSRGTGGGSALRWQCARGSQPGRAAAAAGRALRGASLRALAGTPRWSGRAERPGQRRSGGLCSAPGSPPADAHPGGAPAARPGAADRPARAPSATPASIRTAPPPWASTPTRSCPSRATPPQTSQPCAPKGSREGV